jgi:putative membrane protein
MTRKYDTTTFIARWFVTSLGLSVAALLLGKGVNIKGGLFAVIIAGLVLTVLNSVVKPVLVFFSFPLVLFTLGLFIIVLNGLVVVLASKVYPALHIESFWMAMLAGMIIGLVNYIVSIVQPGGNKT